MALYHCRIRTLRRCQNRTLRDIAGQCGFTVSFLSKIESGKTNPPLATIAKIATALGISLADLIDGNGTGGTVHTTRAKLGARQASRTEKGYTFHMLASERGGKLIQPFLMTAEKGKVKPSILSHRGEEFIYVLAGRMRYSVGSTTYTLGPGDSLYFNSEESHDFSPISKSVRYLAVFAERELPKGKSITK